jgi:phospholipid transport system substrate-binding protein
MICRFCVVITAVAMLGLAVAFPAASAHAGNPPAEAAAPAERLTDSMLETMREADELGFDGRYEKLEPILRENFNFEFMARTVAGRHWRDFSEEEREEFLDRFIESSVATFAARFDGYSGQTFEVRPPREGPRDSVLVPTRLTRPDADSVSIDFLVRQFDEEWQAIDVFLDGRFSELATKRSEYGSILNRQGLPALLERIDQQIAEHRRG